VVEVRAKMRGIGDVMILSPGRTVVVRTYLRGAIEGLLPKIKGNYKVVIPVY